MTTPNLICCNEDKKIVDHAKKCFEYFFGKVKYFIEKDKIRDREEYCLYGVNFHSKYPRGCSLDAKEVESLCPPEEMKKYDIRAKIS